RRDPERRLREREQCRRDAQKVACSLNCPRLHPEETEPLEKAILPQCRRLDRRVVLPVREALREDEADERVPPRRMVDDDDERLVPERGGCAGKRQSHRVEVPPEVALDVAGEAAEKPRPAPFVGQPGNAILAHAGTSPGEWEPCVRDIVEELAGASGRPE